MSPPRNKRKTRQPSARCVKDGVADGWRQTHQRCFSGAGRWNIFSVDQHNLYFRLIAEAGDAIARKSWVANATVLKFNRLERRAVETHNICAYNLISQSVGIHNRAAIKRRNDSYHAHPSAALIYWQIPSEYLPSEVANTVARIIDGLPTLVSPSSVCTIQPVRCPPK